MKAKERLMLVCSYLWLFACIAFYIWARTKGQKGHKGQSETLVDLWKENLPHYFDQIDLEGVEDDLEVDPKLSCRMDNCFNVSQCQKPFLHYVYPPEESGVSNTYKKMLTVLRSSPHYTSDPSKACVFILSLDTLDRDVLSENFIGNLQNRIHRLPHWNNGRNHVIFNLYSGTYPDYAEELGFDTGMAILAKASFSSSSYRMGFDVSLPLFHTEHPTRSGQSGFVRQNPFPTEKKHFLAFKGKRYVYGIGSETRNSLYHLHNGQDQVLLTTCKHGKNWEELKDDRCDDDNSSYDNWDYKELLVNSTFCLVPRGRRLGSFRFIETLQAGCIPVVLSNGWKLPFSEVIDWSEATIQMDERILLQVPELLRSISPGRIYQMRQQTQFLWNKYLAAVNDIVHTTLQIIYERIDVSSARPSHIWNTSPGALWVQNDMEQTPFQGGLEHSRTDLERLEPTFRAVIFVQGQEYPNTLPRLIHNITQTNKVEKIVVVWQSALTPRKSYLSKSAGQTPIEVIIPSQGQVQKFIQDPSIYGDSKAILSLSGDSVMATDEISFSFGVWLEFPDRIVGMVSRTHFWDRQNRRWRLSSQWSNEYSLIMLDGSFHHSFYHRHYSHLLHLLGNNTTNNDLCPDIVMNVLVSHISEKAALKVTQRKDMKVKSSRKDKLSPYILELFSAEQTCFNAVIEHLGYNPLKRSPMRLDPVLYSDAVANTRKKYKNIELMPIDNGARTN